MSASMRRISSITASMAALPLAESSCHSSTSMFVPMIASCRSNQTAWAGRVPAAASKASKKSPENEALGGTEWEKAGRERRYGTIASMQTDMNSPTAVAGTAGASAPYPRRSFSGRELMFSLGSLLLIGIVYQMFWTVVIRPRAEHQIELANKVDAQGNSDRGSLRSIWVIVNDYEQEIAFILASWSIVLIV